MSASRDWAARGLCEAAFAFAIVEPLLFVPQLGAKAPALSFFVTLLYGAVRFRSMAPALLRRWPLLLVPAYALASALWSDYPGETTKKALELTITVLGGLLLSSSAAPAGVLAGVWAAFGVFMAASFAFGGTVTVGSMVSQAAQDTAFAGLNGVKNLFGMTAALAILTSLFMLARAVSRKALVMALAAGGLALLELYLAFIARSAGALVALAVGAAAFLALTGLGALRPAGRLVACSIALLAGTAGVVMIRLYATAVQIDPLGLLNKDPTLTGRAYLWYRAEDFIRERPILGRGFEAFWVQGNMDAEGLWRYGQIAARAGFNFHNTLIELLVHFGWAGAILTLGIFAFTLLNLLRRAFAWPDAASAFYVAFVCLQLARSPLESLMPSSVDFATVLMFAALGYGFRRLPAPLAAVQAPYAGPAGPAFANGPFPRPGRG